MDHDVSMALSGDVVALFTSFALVVPIMGLVLVGGGMVLAATMYAVQRKRERRGYDAAKPPSQSGRG